MTSLNDNILKNFLTGQSSEEELVQINAWIKASDENAKTLFRMEELYHLGQLNENLQAEQIDQAERRLFKAIDLEKSKSQKRLYMRRWMQYAAIITLVVLTASGIYFLKSSNSGSEMLLAAATEGIIKEVTLPDGSKVWLNNGSTLKYPKDFSETERKVYLDGEAYFEVSKNREKPFIAESDAMRIRVLGTHFNLKTSKRLQTAEATLIEGEIEVRGNNNEGMIILNPGQRAEINKSTRRMIVKQVDAKFDAVWHDNLIPFEKADIFTITKALERFYGVKIILSPDIRSDKTYSGVLKRKETIDSVLHSLQNSIPIIYKKSGNNIFISSQNP